MVMASFCRVDVDVQILIKGVILGESCEGDEAHSPALQCVPGYCIAQTHNCDLIVLCKDTTQSESALLHSKAADSCMM